MATMLVQLRLMGISLVVLFLVMKLSIGQVRGSPESVAIILWGSMNVFIKCHGNPLVVEIQKSSSDLSNVFV